MSRILNQGHGYLRGEIGQVLNNLGHQGEGAGGGVIRVFLCEAKKAGGHNGWTKEA